MVSQSDQRTVLRKYLLGELSETDRSRLADRYFAEESIFEELLDVENELLDEYVRGQLPSAQKKQVHDYLARLPDGHTKLATAYALHEARKQLGSTSSSPIFDERQPAIPVVASRWHSLRDLLLARAPIPQYLTITIIIALLSGLIYLFISQRRLQRELGRISVERTKVEQEKLNSEQQARVAQENEALLQRRNFQLEQELKQLQSQTNGQVKSSDGPSLALVVLTPSLRSGTTPDSVVVSGATETVVLVMPIPANEQVIDYGAVLRTTEGRLIFTKKRLEPAKSEHNTKAVSLSLSAQRLIQGKYKLTLHGKGADGVDLEHDFYFNVTRR